MIGPIRRSSAQDDLPTWMPHDVMGGKKLGEGAEGEVWVGQTSDGPIVIKRFFWEHHESFRRKMAVMGLTAACNNLRRIFGGEITPDGNRIVRLEYCSGGSLRDLLNHRGIMAPAMACDLVEQVARGLETMHGQGYIHGDIKPENVLLHRLVGAPLFKICDFCQVIHQTEPPRRVALFSKYYTPPERYESRATTATDLYALGVIWYEVLTGLRIRTAADVEADRIGNDLAGAIATLLGPAAQRPTADDIRYIAADIRSRLSAERYVQGPTSSLSFFTDHPEEYA